MGILSCSQLSRIGCPIFDWFLIHFFLLIVTFFSKFQKLRASKAKADRFAIEENLQNLLRFLAVMMKTRAKTDLFANEKNRHKTNQFASE